MQICKTNIINTPFITCVRVDKKEKLRERLNDEVVLNSVLSSMNMNKQGVGKSQIECFLKITSLAISVPILYEWKLLNQPLLSPTTALQLFVK